MAVKRGLTITADKVRNKILSSACLAILLASLGVACIASPPTVGRLVAPIAQRLWLTYLYWCSMVVAATPYIAAGALGSAAAGRLNSFLKRRGLARQGLRYITPISTVLLCGCECSLLSFAGSLRDTPQWLSVFTLTLGACCNPVALACTARVLGAKLMLLRLCGGFVAAALTALLWPLAGRAALAEKRCQQSTRMAEKHLKQSTCMPLSLASGLQMFSISALAAAIILTCLSRALAAHHSIFVAALAGALISPCSSSDALLARTLFRGPADQIAFVMAAQSFDIRQLLLLRAHFGGAAAALGGAAAVAATGLACGLLTFARP